MQKQPYQYIFLLFVNRRETTAVFKPVPGEGFISISYVFVYVKEHTLKILIQSWKDKRMSLQLRRCGFASLLSQTSQVTLGNSLSLSICIFFSSVKCDNSTSLPHSKQWQHTEDEDHRYIYCTMDSTLQMNGKILFIYKDNKEHSRT